MRVVAHQASFLISGHAIFASCPRSEQEPIHSPVAPRSNEHQSGAVLGIASTVSGLALSYICSVDLNEEDIYNCSPTLLHKPATITFTYVSGRFKMHSAFASIRFTTLCRLSYVENFKLQNHKFFLQYLNRRLLNKLLRTIQ